MEPREFLVSIGCHRVRHSGESLLSHLVGTYALLKGWGASEPECLAGLFHSVYGTVSFQADLDIDRARVREVIGPEAEHLASVFGRRSSRSFAHAVETV